MACAQSAMEAAAAPLAESLVHSKQKTVVIFDFSGPGDRVTQFGEKLADELSAAIPKSSEKIRVVDRSQVEEQRKKDLYSPAIVLDPPSCLELAYELHAKAFVIGQMSVVADKSLSVTLNSYRVENGKGIETVKVVIPINDEMAALMKQDLPGYAAPPDFSKYPDGNAKGYSAPKCLYCPRADYSREAINRKIQGTVELIAVIGEDGLVKDIAISRGLPGGLNAAAVQTVRRWRLAPATGPDGKPAAVREVIEVSFQLF
jgi:TonB family protein